MFRLEKFPDIQHLGKQVIWDTRQKLVAASPLLVLPIGASPATLEDLKKIPHEEIWEEELSPGSHKSLGALASAHFQNPSQKICVIAVTGTNGKSSCAQLLAYFIASLGHKVLRLGTLGAELLGPSNKSLWQADMGFTTPTAPMLQHLLFQCVHNEVPYVVMEASSEALALGRMQHCSVKAGLFTNLTQDHLDFHKTMSEYEKAKLKLFKENLNPRGWAILNGDDPASLRMASELSLSQRIELLYKNRNYKILEQSAEKGLVLNYEDEVFHVPLIGDYNALNTSLVLSVLEKIFERDLVEHLDIHKICADFPGIPGRLQKIPSPANDRWIYIDYAHTPDALENVLRALKQLSQNIRLKVLFGCGGDRDKTKRPLMGNIASRWADEIILSSDNPRTENPQDIVDQIFLGCDPQKTRILLNRKQAIETEVAKLKSHEILLIAGKGHENYQVIGTQKQPFSDFDLAQKAAISLS